MSNIPEKKKVKSVANKVKNATRKEKKREVRAHQKENCTPDDCKANKSGEKKGNPGKSVTMLDTQIKENEQALLRLLEQAHKSIETSESSDDSNVELPANMYKKKKRKAKHQEKS